MTFISILLRASALMVVMYGIHVVFAPRLSATMRHLIWTLAIIGLLLLPALTYGLPGWAAVEVSPRRPPETAQAIEPNPVSSPVVVAPAISRESRSADTRSADARSIPWSVALATLYVAGVLVVLARMMLERRILQRLARGASAVDDPEWTRLLHECAATLGTRRGIRVLRSPGQMMPMTFGTRQPAIVIPAAADGWPAGRRRAVLLHEMAHVARYDCLVQTLAAVACAIYWMHPMVWWIARRLRVERELACDDRVLMSGMRASDYAADLLELAYTLGRRPAPALAVSMASSMHIERRMLAVLDEARNRAMPALSVCAVAAVTTIALLVPLATVTWAVRAPDAPLPSRMDPPFEFAQGGSAATPQNVGTWEIRATGDLRTVHLRLTEGDGSHGSTIDTDQLSGLSTALLSGAGGSAKFTLRRDAGAFHFEGIFRSGVGAGTYTFAPSPDFADALAKRGYARPTPAEQYLLARANFGLAFLDELAAQNYTRASLAQLIRAVQHGVSLTYLREMGQLGYRLKDVDALVTLRDHGVSPQYVREMGAEGLKGLTVDDLVRARSHGVSPNYVRELRAQGQQGLALDALIRLRDHGVSPQYLQELRSLGYEKLTLDTSIQLRNHGVSPEFVRELRTLGYQNLSVDELVRLRNHGVSPSFVRALNDLGYASLTIDELVGLRNHGVSPERIRTANTRAGRRLTVDDLKAAASNGWR